MTKGTGRVVSFNVTGKRNACDSCTCSAGAEAVVDVHELSITNSLYVGLDRTDAGRADPRANAKDATALVDPEPSGSSSFSWTDCGICKFLGPTDRVSVRYFAPDPDKASAAYLAEPLKVHGTATNAEGQLAEANCTTNFTVVKVDVCVDGVGEDKEETEGAFIPYVADATNDVLSVEGTDKLASVSFSCEPELPPDEMVEISCTGPAELFEQLKDGALVKITTTNYPACSVASRVFKLHGHDPSGSYKDGKIRIEHLASEAKDIAKYTSVKVNVEITDYPTKELLGEDKEEMPGAFIPYAADWAFGEIPSDQEDIPFGPSAKARLVDVFISYEPSDLPEDEDRSVKFLEFEAPPDSLYVPSSSANSDWYWNEFVSWWNGRGGNVSHRFEGKKRLVLHGHKKSESQRDCAIRITHPKSGATDVAKYTVYHVDLGIDSDNDLSIDNKDGFEDAIEEREPGKIISWDQSGICPGHDYRVPLQLRAWGGETNAVVRLDAESSSSKVADIYRSAAGGDKLDLPYCFPADSIPSLYVDGVTNGTIKFTATLINPPEGVLATTSVRPIPGLELAEDKVAALVIQPISFAPGRGAVVWSSKPNEIGDGDGVIFDSIISKQGYKVTWYRDGDGERDLSVGDCTANAYLNLDGYGAVTIISHGDVDEHLAVYFPTCEDECRMVYSHFLSRMNGSVGAGALRPTGMASLNIGNLNIGTSMYPTNTSVRMVGNPWTTLCPAPIIDNPTYPSSALAEGEVAFGCLLLDTFVKAQNDMIKVIAGEGVSGIAPLRQEGAEYPFGVGFRIKKGSGIIKVRAEARITRIESVTPNDEFARGRTMDADRISPNGGFVEWEF